MLAPSEKEHAVLVINLWGAPSSGKSTTAAGLFFLLKINKWRVELVTEFAKELVWDGRENYFGNQVSIFAEQNHRLNRLIPHGVEAAVTDSPLPLPAFYQPGGYLPSFTLLVMEQFRRHNNINFFLRRKHSFEVIGRRHDESQAEEIDTQLREFLRINGIDYVEVDASPNAPQVIFDHISALMPPAVIMPLVDPS